MKNIPIALVVLMFAGCAKKLELKPDSQLLLPETVKDFESMLDNTTIMNLTSALSQMSADEYYIPTVANFQALTNPVVKSTYIWQADIFEGRTQVRDWTEPYGQIFICNSVMDILAQQVIDNDAEKKRIKGWALFNRAYAFYTLVSIFAKAYEPTTADKDPGMPLKLSSGVTEIVPRSSVQRTYEQIIADVLASAVLLPQNIPATQKNRPSKIAAWALLARVYTSMRKYGEAEVYADKALALYPTLTDYNTLTIHPTQSSFTGYNSPEVIYFTRNENAQYSATTYSSGALYGVDTALVNLYSASDLRKGVYFRINANGNYAMSKGINTTTYPFTGLATDELYLIKAECLARKNKKDDALSYLNTLLRSRYKTNTFTDIQAASATEALDKILVERKKELIWRCIRWTDLKRLNLEGRNIVLTRKLGNDTYTLEPNSPRYVLPIPDDEITLSGIEQNIR